MNLLKRIQYNAPVTLTFALISLVALILGELTDGWTTDMFFCVYRSEWYNPLTYLRLFTHVLGHANLTHYTNNMMLILLLGPMLEEKYGTKNMIEMIAVVAVVTGVVNLILFPYSGLLGASGVVFMMIILSSMSGGTKGSIPLTLILASIIYVGAEILAGLRAQDNISQLTHIVGGILGCIYGLILGTTRGRRR